LHVLQTSEQTWHFPESAYWPSAQVFTHLLSEVKFNPVAQAKQLEESLQVEQVVSQTLQAPSLKYLPSMHPGVQTPSFKM